ncbi:beta-N-acetylhexosaminidase [Sphingomonas jaspsi]|uniref:beta-N-acetylhexosaminidase n=1 Tax=Sphingomonas jaspsi TaxID=392409 RepID=UPI0004B072A8|nr:beta-N-acetylhexosaminidase [Sphingomonas jaspsi]
MQAAIYGMAGLTLTADEVAFFTDARPAGYILFKRNCETREQLRALTDALRDLEGREDVAISIDQEGGRVARMKAPEWPGFPSGEPFDRLYQIAPSSAIEAMRANALALALMLREVGVNIDLIPNLDLRIPGRHEIVGDRGYGEDPLQVASLGRAVLRGLEAGGCIGVIKHIPGHGRAHADSHLELPVVEEDEAALADDIFPFERLNDAPMAMVNHLLYRAWDGERPASQSPFVIAEIIRKRIGFSGLLMSDDIGMEALDGDHGQRAAACVAAGCDLVLACDGKMENMVKVAGAVGDMGEAAQARFDAAMARIAAPSDQLGFEGAMAKRDALLALA